MTRVIDVESRYSTTTEEHMQVMVCCSADRGLRISRGFLSGVLEEVRGDSDLAFFDRSQASRTYYVAGSTPFVMFSLAFRDK